MGRFTWDPMAELFTGFNKPLHAGEVEMMIMMAIKMMGGIRRLFYCSFPSPLPFPLLEP